MPYLSAITSLPWRFLLGLLAGASLAMGYHAYTLRGVELAETERKYQEQLDAWVAQKNVAEIDERHTKELSDAQAKIDDLASDLASSRKRLRIKVAECVPNASGVDAGATAILDRATEQDYLALRRLLEKKEAQLKGLQEMFKQ